MSLLTPEEQKYLQRYGRYLRSHGMERPFTRFGFNDELSLNDIDWHEKFIYEKGLNAVEISDEFLEIIKNLASRVQNKIRSIDLDDVELWNSSLDIYLDLVKREIEFNISYTYIDENGDYETTFWTTETDGGEEVNELFEILAGKGFNSGKKILMFDGGGDEGYVYDDFDDGTRAPRAIDDWCVETLSEFYGGWDNDTGSNGYFKFNLDDREITLFFSAKVERDGEEFLYKEKY